MQAQPKPKLVSFLCLTVLLASTAAPVQSQDTIVPLARGGGLDASAPMIHVDIFYDADANVMHAELDASYGIPKLTPLPPGYAFDAALSWSVLSGKAYNLQYAWNPGGIFVPPDGAAVWIERLDASPGLENYDGPGNRNEDPPRPWNPILGTDGSSSIWQWYGRMAHNAYAVDPPMENSVYSASYRVYFGDALTGAPDAFSHYDDAVVELRWTADAIPEPGIALLAASGLLLLLGLARTRPRPAGGGGGHPGGEPHSPRSALGVKTIVLGLLISGCFPPSLVGQEFVQPKMGGGQAANAPMIHIDIFYDAQINRLSAIVDPSYGIPELLALEPGLEFDPAEPYACLRGKAYNYQYGWNVGGFFSLPAGAAIWIRQLNSSPGLETYDGRGTRGSYDPIFGTANSPHSWQWTGVMVHNTYAIEKPAADSVFAEYLVYFGDATTGSAEGFEHLDNDLVRLEWRTTPQPGALLFKFGAAGTTHGAPLLFLNAGELSASAEFVLNLEPATEAPWAGQFTGSFPTLAVPATAANGGPAPNHAAPGACLELEIISLTGPAGGRLSLWEPDGSQPACAVAVAESPTGQRIRLSNHEGAAGSDPYGWIDGRRFVLNAPGLYALEFRVLDTSTHGDNGGPIHPPSELYTLYLQAGLTAASIAARKDQVTVVFGGRSGQRFSLQSAPALGPAAQWKTVAGPVDGASRLQRFTSELNGAPASFYRIQAQ